jgi:hypothetical protein
MGKINAGAWQSAYVDIDRATQFVGDDVDQYSGLVDLGSEYTDVLVYIPTITSSTISLMLQKSSSPTEVPLPLNILDDDATGHFLSATTAGTAGMYIVFHVGAAQYLRVKCGSDQAADIECFVRGC